MAFGEEMMLKRHHSREFKGIPPMPAIFLEISGNMAISSIHVFCSDHDALSISSPLDEACTFSFLGQYMQHSVIHVAETWSPLFPRFPGDRVTNLHRTPRPRGPWGLGKTTSISRFSYPADFLFVRSSFVYSVTSPIIQSYTWGSLADISLRNKWSYAWMSQKARINGSDQWFISPTWDIGL